MSQLTSLKQKYKVIEKDPLTKRCIGGSVVEYCLLMPETRVQLPCPTLWCDSIGDMSILFAKNQISFYELIDKIYELHLKYCQSWLWKKDPNAFIKLINVFGEMLISPKCFHKINAPRNLFLPVRPLRTGLISLKRFSRSWIFLLHSLKIPSVDTSGNAHQSAEMGRAHQSQDQKGTSQTGLVKDGHGDTVGAVAQDDDMGL